MVTKTAKIAALSALCTSITSLAVGEAIAQTVGAGVLEVVTVTAQKRSQNSHRAFKLISRAATQGGVARGSPFCRVQITHTVCEWSGSRTTSQTVRATP